MVPFSLYSHLASGLDNSREVLGWTPKSDCMFVLPLVEASRSRSGALVLPDEHRERPQKGVVLAIGAGLWDAEQQKLFPVDVAVGDLVTYGKYAGETFEIGGEQVIEVFIMKNVEIKARRRAGTYPALVEHRVGEGTERDRHVYHESHLKCEHCPVEKSEIVEEERARLQAQHKADLGADPT